MSEPTRYRPYYFALDDEVVMHDEDDGEYVTYADHVARLEAAERIADDLVACAHVNGHSQLDRAKKKGDEGDSEGANWHQGYWVACEEILMRAEDEHGIDRREALARMEKRWDEEPESAPTPEVSHDNR